MSDDKQRKVERDFIGYARNEPFKSRRSNTENVKLAFSEQDILLAEIYGRLIWVLLIVLPIFLSLILVLMNEACNCASTHSLTGICLNNISTSFIHGSILILLLLLVIQIFEKCCTGRNMILILALKKRHLDIRSKDHIHESQKPQSTQDP